jgi:hypothetical protein
MTFKGGVFVVRINIVFVLRRLPYKLSQQNMPLGRVWPLGHFHKTKFKDDLQTILYHKSTIF